MQEKGEKRRWIEKLIDIYMQYVDLDEVILPVGYFNLLQLPELPQHNASRRVSMPHFYLLCATYFTDLASYSTSHMPHLNHS